MEQIHFGTAGLRVSRLALGLGLRGQADERAAERLIRSAYEAGITIFDCANVYGLMDDRAYAGRSEVLLGRALRAQRDEIVITSKVVSPIGPAPNDRGGSRYHIMREVERSLRRLNTDRIDVYLLHSLDATTPLAEQLRALDDLTRQGKIIYSGLCNYPAWQACRALWVQERLGAAPLIALQHPYSLLNRHIEEELVPLAQTLGLGIMAYAPLATGLLSGAYRVGQLPPPGSLWATRRQGHLELLLAGPAGRVLTTVERLAAQRGISVAQMALAWVLAQPAITLAISGADTVDQLAENLVAAEQRLTGEELAELDAVSEGLRLVLDNPALNRPPGAPADLRS